MTMLKYSRANRLPTLTKRAGSAIAILAVSYSHFVNAAPSATTSALKPSDRVVVMISVDGLAADYFDDPKAEMPTIRALAADGARASSMKAVIPTVTWPNHTTLVTGVTPARHGVIGNNYYDRAAGKRVVLIADPVYDKDQIVKAPTLYDLAKAAGLSTASFRWPATRNAKSLDWTTPDVKSLDLLKKYTTPAVAQESAAEGIKLIDDAANPDSASPTDEATTRAFNLILKKHRPNLALLHLIAVDHDEHLYGPRTPEAYATIKKADEQVGEVWTELKHDFPGKATLFVVSDHGFSLNKTQLFPKVALRKAGLLEASGKNTTGPVQLVAQGGAELVYITDDAHRAELVERVKKAFASLPGISRIVTPDQLNEYGVANPKDDPNGPDMVLLAKEGYNFGDTASGDLPFKDKPERKGSHGHDPAIPHLHATFVAWGAGIKPKSRLGEIQNTDVAPTAAKLLGLTIPNAEGKILTRILEN